MKPKKPLQENFRSIDRAVAAENKVRNEVTSKRVSAIAGRILQRLGERECFGSVMAEYFEDKIGDTCLHGLCTVVEMKALAASCLTQSKDRLKSDKPRRAK